MLSLKVYLFVENSDIHLSLLPKDRVICLDRAFAQYASDADCFETSIWPQLNSFAPAKGILSTLLNVGLLKESLPEKVRTHSKVSRPWESFHLLEGTSGD